MPLTREVCELLIPTKDSAEWWNTKDKQGMNAVHGMVYAKRDLPKRLVADVQVSMAVMGDERKRGGKEKCREIARAVLEHQSKWGTPVDFLRWVNDAECKRKVRDMLTRALRG